MLSIRHKHHVLSFINFGMYLFLISLLIACSPITPPVTRKATPTQGTVAPTRRFVTPISATTTVTMPPTQTDCPPAETARAILTAPLATGNHQTIVYTLNQGSYDTPSQGKLVRYDVQTGHTSELIHVAQAHIYEAQVSADGEWTLFVSTTGSVGRQTKLQLLRMDGQGLQTLYCAAGYGIQQLQWSADQHYLVFYNVVNEQGVIYLLDMNSGRLKTELTTPPQVGLILRTWLDATHIYLNDTAVDTLYARVYLLDINKKARQHLSDLLIVIQQDYGDFDSSDDGTSLFITNGNCRQGTCDGPSHIVTQAISGGKQHTLYSSPVYDVVEVRVIDHNSLIFIVGNTLGATDTSHNGLWKMQVDGSGLTRLIATSSQQYSYLNYSSQEPWSNISRDASMYVLQVNGFQGIVQTDSLVVGSLHGGTPRAFTSISDGSQLAMVGWTVL